MLTESLLDPVISGECDDEQDDGSKADDIGSGNPLGNPHAREQRLALGGADELGARGVGT